MGIGLTRAKIGFVGRISAYLRMIPRTNSGQKKGVALRSHARTTTRRMEEPFKNPKQKNVQPSLLLIVAESPFFKWGRKMSIKHAISRFLATYRSQFATNQEYNNYLIF